jgi:hypothetical protein
MAILRLLVEIDREVYPELYAKLRAIQRLAARAERLRQLAATGLVWEAARMQAAGVAAPLPAPRPPGPPLPPERLPVLLDVIEELPSEPVPLAAADDAPPLPPPLQAGVHRPAPRSARLKRMLDRGLFRNG